MNIPRAIDLGNLFTEMMVEPVELSGISKESVGEMRDPRLGKLLVN